MKKALHHIFMCFILVLLFAASALTAEVEPEITDVLQQEQKVSVIVILKNQPGNTEAKQVLDDADDKIADAGINVERQYSTIPGFSGTVTAEGLEQLESDSRVEAIFLNKVYHITLDTTVPQVNAHKAWNLSIGGYNITGKGETICVLDTGIDTDHPAFQDKIKSQYCYCSNCCPGGGSENTSAEDDHGHGTHVAGIAAGNLTTYTGVAKDAGIYAIKVCNAAGSCVTSDLIAGIDRCSNSANITAFNISAISISLGDTSQNNAYCNNDALAPSINTAVGRNISVVIASGNNGYTAGISSPACVQNATPVGTVDDTDAISYNRGAILELLAPGISITSATLGGGTTSLSGTSMSAPHAAGAIAIFRQYWRLAYSRTPTVDEIKRKFMITGKLIDDSSNSGKNYSRIDILAALQEPIINFTDTSAANNSVITLNYSFINVTSDVNLTSSLLEWAYANGSVVNLTLIKFNSTNFYLNVTHLQEGIDTYHAYWNDTFSIMGTSTTRIITIDYTTPAVTFTNPANGSNLSSGTQAFNVTIADLSINTVIFQFNNASGNDFNISPANISGNWNTNLNLTRLTEGLHSMMVYANDSAGNLNNTPLVEFTVDRTPPAVTFIFPAAGQSYTLASGNQSFNATVADALLTVQSVLFSFDNASGAGFNITAVNQSGSWIASYNVSSLANGTHTVTIFANDTLGNVNNTQSINFTVDTTPFTITLLTPVNGNQNSSTAMTFNCSARNYVELTNITLYGNWGGWHANETKTVSGNSSSATFSKTLSDATHIWNCQAYDTSGNSAFASSNFTLTIDTAAPIISSVSSGTPASTSATITWATNEKANATVNYGTVQSLGTISSTTSRSTSQSRALSSLTAATEYFYNVTSCDALGNCRTNGTFNFTTAAASSNAGGSSGAAGGGGGGGSSSPSASTTSAVKELEDETDSAEDATSGADSAEAGVLTERSATQPLLTFSQSVSFSKGQPSVVTINEEKLGIKEIEVDSKVDKETTFTISYLEEKPAELPEIRNPYQYFEITVDLTADDIEKATATFEVPASWLKENNFLKETVALNTFDEISGKWKKLSTKFIEEKEDVLVYQAKLKHFSYFSITANSELEFSWFKNLIPPKFGTRGFVIFGIVVLIAFLLLLYWFLHRGEGREDRV